ncbi:hypothetical protein J594_0758 [Acinetobacter sp. 259052]|nr:hypothetical protein J594_0758 [Acinetobacter sp. 259052]
MTALPFVQLVHVSVAAFAVWLVHALVVAQPHTVQSLLLNLHVDQRFLHIQILLTELFYSFLPIPLHAADKRYQSALLATTVQQTAF